jgi:hypothetical protein
MYSRMIKFKSIKNKSLSWRDAAVIQTAFSKLWNEEPRLEFEAAFFPSIFSHADILEFIFYHK